MNRPPKPTYEQSQQDTIDRLIEENEKLTHIMQKIKALDSPERKESYENDFDTIMDLIEPIINPDY